MPKKKSISQILKENASGSNLKKADDEKNPTSKKIPVEVAMLTGQILRGTIEKFSIFDSKLLLNTNDIIEKIPYKKISYIAFIRTKSGEESGKPAGTTTLYRLYLRGGYVLDVEVVSPYSSEQIGFYAFPHSESAPYSHYFIFTHAIYRREIPEKIGQLAYQKGLINTAELEMVLKNQRELRKKRLGEIIAEEGKVSPEIINKKVLSQKRRISKKKIGELLIEEGLVSAEDISRALEKQRKLKNKRLGEILVDLGLISERKLMMILAEKFNLPFLDLDEREIDFNILRKIPPIYKEPERWLESYRFLPVHIDDQRMVIAIDDPFNTEAGELLRFICTRRIVEALTLPSQLQRYIQKAIEFIEKKKKESENKPEEVVEVDKIEEIIQQIDTGSGEEEEDKEVAVLLKVGQSDAPIIKLAEQIILDAYHQGVSDIHIEPNGREYPTVVRFRVDGRCFIYRELAPAVWRPLVSRFKIMANLDIAEKRKPQDGKIRIQLPERILEMRVATIPTVNGNEDVVIRLLASSKPRPLKELGMSERNLKELTRVIERPYGLILCVGPTGSGKTTTLHSLLSIINRPEKKIWTAEDPVEITQKGLRQVQVKPQIGLTFASVMRSFLRADPDVIMVGEMRDKETSQMAVEASLTGHLVLSTLHTNSAPETITRLLDMGLDPFSFADSLLAILAQRLARTLCSNCKEPYTPSQEEFQNLIEYYGEDSWKVDFSSSDPSDYQLYRAKGCEKCKNTGYKGRIGIHELLIADDEEIRQLIQRRSSVQELRALAKSKGMRTLLQDGIAKVLKGHTDFKQIYAVANM